MQGWWWIFKNIYNFLEYGPPDENEMKKPPTSLKSQLIQVKIVSPDHQLKSYSKKVPYNMSVQKLAGLIQRLFNTGYEIPRLTCVHSEVSRNFVFRKSNYFVTYRFCIYEFFLLRKISYYWSETVITAITKSIVDAIIKSNA